MLRRVVAWLLVASLTATCGGGPGSSPAPTGPPASQPPASSGFTPGPSSVIPSTAAPSTPPFVRLAWEEVGTLPIPRYRFMTSVSTSERGTLLRYVVPERPSTVEGVITMDGRSWARLPATPLDDSPLGRAIEGGPDWLQVAEPLGGEAPLDLLASSDGTTWQVRGHLPVELLRVGGAAIHGQVILACGAARDPAALTTCATSPDLGATWTRQGALDGLLGDGRVMGVVGTSSGFAVVVEGVAGRDVVARTAVSADGNTWTVLPDAALTGISPDIAPRLGSLGGVLVIWGAVLDGGAFVRGLWASRDGRSWRRVPLPRIEGWAGTLEAVSGALVAFAETGNQDDMRFSGALVSGNGLDWRQDTLPDLLTSRKSWEWRVEPLGDALLVFEQATGSAAEPPRALLARPVLAADPGPAPAPTPTPLPQPSGAAPPTVSWAVSSSQRGSRVADVTTWQGGYLAVGYQADDDGPTGGAMAWFSTDGRTWEQVLGPTAYPGTRMLTVAARDGLLVAAGDALGARRDDASSPVAAFWRSEDGRQWERIPDRPDFVIGVEPVVDSWWTGLTDLVAGGPGFVAVGATRAGGATAWTTTDGRDWQRSATLGPAVILSAAAGGPGLVAQGETGGPSSMSRIWISPDGRAWTLADEMPFPGPGRLASLGGSIIAAGLPPWQSLDGQHWDRVPAQPAFERTLVQETMAAVVIGPWGSLGAGGAVCPADLRVCPAVWLSSDGLAWSRTLLPEADRAWAACPSCRIVPVAGVADSRAVLLVGASFLSGGPFDAGPGWASWVGTLEP